MWKVISIQAALLSEYIENLARNRILHLGVSNYGEKEATICFNIAELGLRVLEYLDEKKMQKLIVTVLLCFMLAGCGGRAAAPVMVHQYGDGKKSCKALESDIAFIESEISRLIPKTEKTGKNVALGVTGVFLIVPWFFMDFSKAEQIEVNALRQRYNHLVILADEKKCGFDNDQIPDFKKPKNVSSEGEAEEAE